MYLKINLKKWKGRVYRYWTLVETIRTSRGPRQRVAANLGDLTSYTAEDFQRLADRMGEPEIASRLKENYDKPHGRGRPRKLDLELSYPKDSSDIVQVSLSTVGWKEPRDFGDIYAGLVMWKRLGLEELLERLIPKKKEKVSMCQVAALIAVNRLVSPRSEWGMLSWWKTTALPSILGIPVSILDDNRLYRCLDAVAPHKEEIERHLAKQGMDLFSQDYSMFLYDITSVYFEGICKSNPKAKRGYSRDHRPDCKQVCIGLVTDGEGYPVGYEVFDGNIKDHQTVEGIIKKLESRFGICGRIICMDRGMLTEETLKFLQSNPERRYIIAERRDASGEFIDKIRSDGWQAIREDKDGKAVIRVQEVGVEGQDRLILVHSAGCEEKEKGIHDRFLNRLGDALNHLTERVRKGRLKDSAKIERAIGGILARHPGVSRWVHVKHLEEEGNQRIHWHVKPDWHDVAKELEGVYLLRTNFMAADASQLWEYYITLNRIEASFRTMKHDLNLRPIFHHKEKRVLGHILFSFLGYVLYWSIEQWHRRHGGKLSGRRVLEVLHQIKVGTITAITKEGIRLKLQRISQPSKEELEVLHTLGIELSDYKL